MMMGWAAAWFVKAWLVNAAAAQDVAHCIVGGCVEINQCVGCTR